MGVCCAKANGHTDSLSELDPPALHGIAKSSMDDQFMPHKGRRVSAGGGLLFHNWLGFGGDLGVGCCQYRGPKETMPAWSGG